MGGLDPDLKCIEGAENIMECTDGVKNRKVPRSKPAGDAQQGSSPPRTPHQYIDIAMDDAAGGRELRPKVQLKSRPAFKPESLPILDHQDSQDEDCLVVSQKQVKRHGQAQQHLHDAPAPKRQQLRASSVRVQRSKSVLWVE